MSPEEKIGILIRLKELLDAGILTQEEFEKEKASILDGTKVSQQQSAGCNEGQHSHPAGPSNKRKTGGTLWIVLGCIAGLFLITVLASRSFSGDSYDEGEVIEFIRTMYNAKQYTDHAFLESHCTKKMLKKLTDNFGYECDGTCYATWLFRSGAQDEKYGAYSYYGNGVNESKIIDIVRYNDHWYDYTALDMGWLFTNRISIIKSGKSYLIDDVVKVADEMP